MKSRQQATTTGLVASAAMFACLSVTAVATAGSHEFPAAGTRGLGRGGAAMARADDPSAMLRNPALLADLVGDQALFGAHLLMVDACFRPEGHQGIGVRGADLFDVGDGPIAIGASGVSTVDGSSIVDIGDEPFWPVCFEGPAPFLPTIAFTFKLTETIGVGLGFFPPDTAIVGQWGNRDGTVDTPVGKRPNPLRFMRSSQQTTLLPLLGSLGVRFSDWLAVGLSFQWSLIAFDVTNWSSEPGSLSPSSNIRVDLFGRDLFVPGFVASVHLTPLDWLDVSLSARWSDRIVGKAKLDVTTGAFATGSRTLAGPGGLRQVGSRVPHLSEGVIGNVDAPPLWVPRLALAVRVSDRLLPRQSNRGSVGPPGRVVPGGGSTDDAMLAERWDVEFDLVYYVNSAYDFSRFSNADNADVGLREAGQSDGSPLMRATIGRCPVYAGDGVSCATQRVTETRFVGRDQLSLRLGGDYNVLPGRMAVRAGVSYETEGVDRRHLHPMFNMLGRTGLHVGATVRIDGRTDISAGVAYFVRRTVRLAGPATTLRNRDARYHVPQPGEPVDGQAALEVPSSGDRAPGLINAGTHVFALTVLSASIGHHF